jgi:signal transduction histidine kinase
VIEAEATLALMRERESEEYRAALATIAEESASMHKLINQLLTLARGDSLDRESFETEVFDLGSVVAEVSAALEPLAKERGIELSAEMNAIHIEGDPVRVRQLIVNLLDNAIRYTDQGGSVRVDLDTEGTEAVLRVKDSGIGIAPEHLKRVFERFVRLDSSRHRGGEASGSGLGLAICRQIVSLHGGAIAVESTPGQGSTFTVRLRRCDA